MAAPADLEEQTPIRGEGVEPTTHWLDGLYAPVREELSAPSLEVIGNLPSSLCGTYLRNGPNPLFTPISRYHIFDGDGMVHGVSFDGEGGASYRNRWVRSRGLAAEQAARKSVYGGLSEFIIPPAEIASEYGMMKNTANTNVVSHAGKILALMEACPPIELAANLATVGEYSFGGKLEGAMTAHPKFDPRTGEMIFFGYGPFPPYLRVHSTDAAGNLTWSTEVELLGPVMMHDFIVTDSRVIIFDLPAVFDVPAMLQGGNGIRWEPERGTRIGVLERGAPGDAVQWIEVDPFWVFHFLNAHDEGDSVIAAGCRAPKLNVDFSENPSLEIIEPMLHRWTIDLANGTVSDEPLADEAGDFPRINDNYAGLAHRHGYVGHTRRWGSDEVEFDGVTKHDLSTGRTETHVYGPDHVCGEAVFAVDPDRATDEDGGWLLNFVTNRSTKQSRLVVLDAATLETAAEVVLPQRVPFGFHGNFVASGR